MLGATISNVAYSVRSLLMKVLGSVFSFVLICFRVNINFIFSDDTTTLLLAAERGMTFVADLLLHIRGVDVNAKDQNGNTALMLAVERGLDVIVTHLMLIEGIEIDCKNKNGETVLMLAAKNGYVDILPRLLEIINVNNKNNAGSTVLMLAAENGHANVVSYLLEVENIAVNVQDFYGKTALILAAENGHANVVSYLLEVENIAVNIQGSDGKTALILAADGGYESIVYLLLSSADIDVNKQDVYFYDALTYAEQEGHIGIAELLRPLTNLVSLSPDNASIALTNAARRGHADLVARLLEVEGIKLHKGDEYLSLLLINIGGVKFYKESMCDIMSLMLFENGGHKSLSSRHCLELEFIELFYDNDDTALTLAAENGHVNIFFRLLEAEGIDLAKWGCDGDLEDLKRNSDLRSLAHRALQSRIITCKLESALNVFRDEARALDLLRLYDRDLNRELDFWDTPLMFAVKSGFYNIVYEILQYPNINVNAKGRLGITALMIAAIKGYENIVCLLLTVEGIDVNIKDENFCNAFLYAESRGNTEIANILKPLTTVVLDAEEASIALVYAAEFDMKLMVASLLGVKGIKVNARGYSENTPLMFAADRGCANTVSLLLNAEGIDVNAKNEHHTTALMTAAGKGHKNIVDVLLRVEGIDVNAKDIGGDTALMIAAGKGHKNIVDVLLRVEGIDINAKDIGDDTALILAMKKKHINTVSLLLGVEGIDVHAEGIRGDSVLILAMKNSYIGILKYLIKYKNIKCDSAYWESVYRWASKDVLQYFLFTNMINIEKLYKCLKNTSNVSDVVVRLCDELKSEFDYLSELSVSGELNNECDHLSELSSLDSLRSASVSSVQSNLSDYCCECFYRRELLIAKMYGKDFEEDFTVKSTGMSMLKFRATSALMRIAKIGKLISGGTKINYIIINMLMLRKNAGSEGRFPFFENMPFDINAYLLEFIVGEYVERMMPEIRAFRGESPAASLYDHGPNITPGATRSGNSAAEYNKPRI